MILAIVAALMTPTAVPSPTPADAAPAVPAPTTAAPAPEPEERVVCRTIQRTGTRLASRRVCRTVAQHRESDAAARDAAREIQRDGAGMADDNPFGSGAPTGPGGN